MCGIVYRKDFTGGDVTHLVTQQYLHQKGRGRQGFGFYLPQQDHLTHNPNERRIFRNLGRFDVSEVLLHHRFPTSTPNVRNSCHPFSTRRNGDLFDREYVLVHNGVLFNDDVLQEAHQKLGIEYVSKIAGSFNDSEALLYDVALFLEGKQDQLKSVGAVAFIVVEKDKSGEPLKLHWFRNFGSPLIVDHQPGQHLAISSEGEGELALANELYSFDYATGKIRQQFLRLEEYDYSYTNSQYAQGIGQGLGYNEPYADNAPSGNYWTLDEDGEAQYINAIDEMAAINNTLDELTARFDTYSDALQYAEQELRTLDGLVEFDLELLDEFATYNNPVMEREVEQELDEIYHKQELWTGVIAKLETIIAAAQVFSLGDGKGRSKSKSQNFLKQRKQKTAKTAKATTGKATTGKVATNEG